MEATPPSAPRDSAGLTSPAPLLQSLPGRPGAPRNAAGVQAVPAGTIEAAGERGEPRASPGDGAGPGVSPPGERTDGRHSQRLIGQEAGLERAAPSADSQWRRGLETNRPIRERWHAGGRGLGRAGALPVPVLAWWSGRGRFRQAGVGFLPPPEGAPWRAARRRGARGRDPRRPPAPVAPQHLLWRGVPAVGRAPSWVGGASSCRSASLGECWTRAAVRFGLAGANWDGAPVRSAPEGWVGVGSTPAMSGARPNSPCCAMVQGAGGHPEQRASLPAPCAKR